MCDRLSSPLQFSGVLPRLCAGLTVAVLLAAGPLCAQTPSIGPRSMGMAGASVAVAEDGTALWTNPAGLARDPRIDLSLFVGAAAANRNEFTVILDRLASLDFSRLRSGRDLDRIPPAVADLRRLAARGTGVVGSGVGGLVFGRSGWAVGIGDAAFAGVSPTVDLLRVLPVADSSIPESFVNNRTGLTLIGLEAREARLAYSRGFFGRALLVGGTVRYVRGRTYYLRERLFDEDFSDPAGLARRALRENARDTSKLAFDAGAMLNVLGRVRVALVSTAINEPTFRVASNPLDPSLAGAPASIRLPRTLRAGIAAQPIGLLTIAADWDLVESATLLRYPDGSFAGSRQLALGAEARLPLIALRGGAFRDSAAPDPHWAYSAGIGLGIKSVSVNAAVVISTHGGLSLSSTNRRDVGAALDARVRF